MKKPNRFTLLAFAFVSAFAAGSCAPGESDIETAHGDDEEMGDSVSLEEATSGSVGVRVPASLALERGVVYLTFDDGPSPRYTARILDTLAAHHAPATFFVTGASIASNAALLRREDAEGHIVASHQWSHVIATAAQFSTWATRERDLLDTTLGHPHTRYFRYPYGAGTNAKEAVLREAGYPDGGVGWDIDSLDWCFGLRNQCTRAEVPAAYRNDFEGFVLSQIQRRNGGVALFHDVQGVTANRLDALLTRIEAAGFRFGALPTEGRVPAAAGGR